jgi:hypothetical protein
MLKSKLLSATAAAPEVIAIEDVFSTYLYTGNGSTQTITNGIDLAGEGGMVWLKGRTTVSGHGVYDTERGVQHIIQANSTAADYSPFSGVTAFNSNGFTIGSQDNNNSGVPNASWTFRKAPRFFDVVTYTGTGSGGFTVSHNLGQDVGFLAVKRTNSAGDWVCWHRSRPNAYLVLQTTAAEVTTVSSVASRFGDNTNIIQPTSTEFTLGGTWDVNQSGGTYVAYLFAHDPLGPSGDGSDGLIACGSFTTDASGNVGSVSLGWEPQWILTKRTDSTQNWYLFDTMRGFAVTNQKTLSPNLSNSELDFGAASYFYPTSEGFAGSGNFFGGNATVSYIAIRRGPMREPTSGTEVFGIDSQTTSSGNIGAWSAGFVTDASIKVEQGGIANHDINSRLTGNVTMYTDATNAESASSEVRWDYQEGFGLQTSNFSLHKKLLFRRAPGFFDVVAYTGDGVVGRTITHNLGSAPELMIIKARNNSANWAVYHGEPTKYMFLNSTNATTVSSGYWNNTAPTASVFTVGGVSAVNVSSAYTYIAYLFATLPGVSKVGSYTGNGSSQTINCSFTGGARFVLIKRTDSTGDWYVWDTARGIVSGNDPHLSLNTTAAEVTSDDTIDPDSSGFIVNQVSATNVNVSSASYIYLAIA